MTDLGSLVGTVLLVLIGGVIGRLRDLSERLKEELARRERVEDALQRQNLGLTAFNAISRALASSLELQEMLDETLSRTVDVLGVTGGLIALDEGQTGELELVSHVGLPDPLLDRLRREGMEDSLCGVVYREGKPLSVPSLWEEMLAGVDDLLETSPRSYVGIPIVHKGRKLGTLCTFSTTPSPAPESAYALLTAIGQQIGVAVENARLFEEAVREREVAHTLLGTTESLSTTLRFQELVDRVLDGLRQIVPYDVASVILLHDDRCQVVASSGHEHGSGVWRMFALDDHPLVRRVVDERRHLVVSDVGDEPPRSTDEHLRSLHAWLGIPLTVRDRVIGVLELGSRTARCYEKDVSRLALAFARQAAMAIENSRLYEKMRSQLREVTVLQGVTTAISSTLDVDRILPYVARSLCEILNGTSVEIFSLVGEHNVAIAKGDYAAAEATEAERCLDPERTEFVSEFPTTVEAVANLRPLQIGVGDSHVDRRERARLEARGAQAMLLLPLVRHRQIIGFARVWDSTAPRRFTEGEIATGQTLIHQAAIAMENARLFEQIQAALAETQALYRTSRSLIAQESLSDVLQTVVDGVVEALPADRVTVITFDLEGGRVVNFVKGGPGSDQVVSTAFQELWEGLSGWVLRELRPALSPKEEPDPREGPDAQRRREETNCGSIIVVPLLYRGKALGTMTAINRPDQRNFTERDVDLMMAFANQSAAALENARLIEETQRRASQLAGAADVARHAAAIMDREQLLQVAIDLIQEQFGFNLAGAFLVDDVANELYVAAATEDLWGLIPDGYRQPIGKGAIGMAAATGETVRVTDTDPTPYQAGDWLSLSSLSVPLQVGGLVIGVLEIEADVPNAFDGNDQVALEVIADQIAIAFQNAELLTETRSRVKELQLLHGVSLAASSSVHLEETLQAAAEALAAEWKDTRVALQLIDPQANVLRAKASVGYPREEIDDLSIQLGQGVTGWVAEYGKPALVPDVRRDPRYYEVMPDTRSELCVPLAVGPQVIGALNVESPEIDAFTHNDQRLLSTLAGNLSVLIERARLFEEIEAARAELQQRAEALEQANERLKELDRLKSQFLANMSHELRTPLNSIIGFSEVLIDGLLGEMPPDRKECVENIYVSGEHLMALINDILDLSKIEAGRMELTLETFNVVDLVANVQRTIMPMIEEKSQLLKVELADDLPPLAADRIRVRQVLLNLLSNAHKFTPEEGEITLSCRLADSATMQFSVADTGIGIKPEDHEIIFEEFRQANGAATREVEGTGLGLTISKRLVEMHDGSIWVESEYGEGTTFSLMLPIAGPSTRASGEADELGLASVHKTVLVVEDDRQFSNLLSLYLRKEGYEPVQHYRGTGVVERVRELNPALVTLDIMLPERDGWEILQALKSTPATKTIPVLVISALKNSDLALSLGAADYLVKPVDQQDLRTLLDRLKVPEPRSRETRLLVVDDDPDLVPFLRAMLQDKRYALLPAYSGEEGIAMARSESIDGVLLDLMMPGMSGFQVLERLQADEETADLPVIVLTAKNVTEEEREQIDDHIQTLMHKSVLTPQALLGEIRSLAALGR